MKKNRDFYRILLFGIVGLGYTLNLNAQEITNTPSIYIWFDQMIGKTNSGLFNGIQYIERYKVINEKHHFFKEPNFVLGSIIYDGQPYFNLELKYNVFDDELLLKNSEKSMAPIVQLNKHKITNFTINQHRFTNISFNKNSVDLTGFFEILDQNDSIVLYKKHLKKQFAKTDRKTVYYEFKSLSEYYIQYKNSFYKIKKLRNFNSIFPSYSKELNEICSRYEAIRKLDPDSSLISVVTDLYHVLIEEE